MVIRDTNNSTFQNPIQIQDKPVPGVQIRIAGGGKEKWV